MKLMISLYTFSKMFDINGFCLKLSIEKYRFFESVYTQQNILLEMSRLLCPKSIMSRRFYVQGQPGIRPNEREYFYHINHQG